MQTAGVFLVISIIVNFAFTKFISIPSGKILHIGKYHIHHSMHGVIFLLLGLFAGSNQNIFTGIGLGTFLEHGFEEWYFHKINPVKGMFLFISDLNKEISDN